MFSIWPLAAILQGGVPELLARLLKLFYSIQNTEKHIVRHINR